MKNLLAVITVFLFISSQQVSAQQSAVNPFIGEWHEVTSASVKKHLSIAITDKKYNTYRVKVKFNNAQQTGGISETIFSQQGNALNGNVNVTPDADPDGPPSESKWKKAVISIEGTHVILMIDGVKMTFAKDAAK